MGVEINEVVSTGGLRVHDPGWGRRYIRTALIGDLLALAVSLAALAVVRSWLGYLTAQELLLAGVLVVVWPGIVRLVGGYDRRFLGEGPDEYRRVFQATLGMASAVAIIAYATQTPVARAYVMVGIPTAGVLALGVRFLLRKRLHRLRYEGKCMRRVVAVGHWGAILELHGQLSRGPHHGMKIVAACVPADGREYLPPQFDGFPVLGDFSEVPQVVRAVDADTVAVLACPEFDGVALRRLAWQLEKTGTDLYVASALIEVTGPRINIRPVAGLPLLHVAHPDLAGVRQAVKSAFDRLVAALALVLLSPLFLAVAVAIKLDGPGPVLFRQTRVGRAGRTFTLLKFRTMVPDAERLKSRLAEANESDGVLFKIRNDPRVTPVGSWLRRYSIDELPQLVNVLRGDMSLVGPRPPLPSEVERFETDTRRRLVVKPGMTGLWQVSGRSNLSWEESVRLDLRYVENWSLVLDLLILWKTWRAVVRAEGAY